MDLEDVLGRIESRLKLLGLSAHAASLAAKKPDAIRNLKRAVKSGDRRGITTETLIALAPVLKTSAAWLLEGVGEPGTGTLAKVVGKIGAGAEILPEYEQIPPEGLFEITVPFPIPEDTIAFEVEGESMWPRYDAGDVIICWKQTVDPRIGRRPRSCGAHRRWSPLSQTRAARRRRGHLRPRKPQCRTDPRHRNRLGGGGASGRPVRPVAVFRQGHAAQQSGSITLISV